MSNKFCSYKQKHRIQLLYVALNKMLSQPLMLKEALLSQTNRHYSKYIEPNKHFLVPMATPSYIKNI